MINNDKIIEDTLKFKGFWKASLSDKLKWLIIYPFILVTVISYFLSRDK